MPEAVLAADLAKFAGPIGEDSGKPGVRQICIRSLTAAVKAAADGPAAIGAVFGIGIKAECVLGLEKSGGRNLVAGAPEKFVAKQEGVVDRAAQRLPTESGVGGVKIGEETGRIESGADAGIVVAAGIGHTEVEIGRFAEVAVGAEVADNTEVLAAPCLEQIVGIAAKNLSRPLKKPVFRRRQETRQGESGIINTVFTADEIVGHERADNERQGVIVNGVDLAEV